MRKLFYLLVFLISSVIFIYSCTKQIGSDPQLAFTDRALVDSCKNSESFYYYQNNPLAIYSGVNGPHGNFKLKFNKIAYSALTAGGKLPVGAKFPEGSLVVKEAISGGSINIYAIMYKHNNSWLWGEIRPDYSVIYSVKKEPSPCISCHQQSGNRDLVNSFTFY